MIDDDLKYDEIEPTYKPMPWDQLPGESGVAYHRFMRFLMLGPNRCLQRAHRDEYIEEHVADGVPPDEIKIPKMTPSNWRKDYKKFEWKRRAEVYDKYILLKKMHVYTYRQLHIEQKHLEAASKLQGMIERAFAKLDKLFEEDKINVDIQHLGAFVYALNVLDKIIKGKNTYTKGEPRNVYNIQNFQAILENNPDDLVSNGIIDANNGDGTKKVDYKKRIAALMKNKETAKAMTQIAEIETNINMDGVKPVDIEDDDDRDDFGELMG